MPALTRVNGDGVKGERNVADTDRICIIAVIAKRC